jgi:cellulose synthase/poly-beta-1,6-N-acetylglucosamine synthase-like glycosyltransferase
MLAFYFFTGVVVVLGVLYLRGGFRFARYVRAECGRSKSEFTPFVSVIAPCRGLETGFKENIEALFRQQYPEYEIVFVTDRADDPAIDLIRETISESAGAVNARVVIAGAAVDRGQKVHNLSVAVSVVDPRSEVLVFVDTDARPNANWLRSLVAPLADTSIGAATGYRWFIPERGGFSSQLRSVWNASIASALGKRGDKNFCWGGSTAIRRSTFNQLGLPGNWRGTVSDDFALTSLLHAANLPIHFVPQCLVPSVGDCGARELLEFTNRQLKITRVYAPHLWRPLLIGSLLFCLVFFGGIALVIARALLGLSYLPVLILLVAIFLLGAAKAFVRFKVVELALNQRLHGLLAHLFLWPLASALYLVNALTAACSRRIKWRGITYELKSASEAVIIARDS